ncbi:MAG: hypothetical protein DBY05_02365 [Clostridiales bacterium]|nr:MAG: hypothetical protein DBY05_02365 [Clostridiales bacterium]
MGRSVYLSFIIILYHTFRFFARVGNKLSKISPTDIPKKDFYRFTVLREKGKRLLISCFFQKNML